VSTFWQVMLVGVLPLAVLIGGTIISGKRWRD